MADAVDGEDEFEAVDQRLSENQKFCLYKDLEGYRSLWDTSYVPSKNKHQNKLQKEKDLEELSQKYNYIHAYTLSDFVSEAFPRLLRAKGPNRERQALSSDIACSRLSISGAYRMRPGDVRRAGSGGERGKVGRACKHCFKNLIPVYQLPVNPMIGLF